MKPNISLREIAEKANVSPATVSRVMNKNGRYSKDTEERVLRIIEEYGYSPNQLARGLRLNRGQIVGIIVPDITNEFFSKLIQRIQNRLFEHDYPVVIYNTNESMATEKKCLKYLRAQSVSGVVYINGSRSVEGDMLKDIPTVYIDRRPEDSPRPKTRFVSSDNEQGGYLATREMLEQGSRQYTVDEKYIYRCHNGLWSVQKYSCIPHSNGKLGDVLKAIDAVMRECYGYGRPIQYKLETKWIIKIIQEEAQNLLAEKKAAEEKKITIDYSRLARIRDDAAVTRDRLMVDEEAEEEAPPAQPPEPAAEPEDTPLTKDEYRLLQSLLYGRDYGWVRSSGLMLSVLVDGINDKLYDTFSDSVLLGDDPPELIEDYIADLKEMIHP